MATPIRIGCCGFALPQAEYMRRFRLVEIQQTFYQPPRKATVLKWRERAPDDFEFTLKAFQAITHPGSSPTYRRSRLSPAERRECGFFRDTGVVRNAWTTTCDLATALEATFVVLQCPESFRPTEENTARMRAFLTWAPRGSFRIGWEPRGSGWSDDLVAELCREFDLVHVVDPFVREPTTRSPRYFRLHGIGRGGRPNYRYEFSDDDLLQLQRRCGKGVVYCLFNNLSMARDALRFRELVEANATPFSET